MNTRQPLSSAATDRWTEPSEAAVRATPATPQPVAAAGENLLDFVLGQTPATGPSDTARSAPNANRHSLAEFLAESHPVRAIALWLAHSAGPQPQSAGQALRRLARDVARLDQLLNAQVNAILHHPSFQKLEAAWRGLRFLVEQVEEGHNVQIRVFPASWKDVTRDLERAMEFDQSVLFRKIYTDEFDTPGGQPYGLLLGDFELHPRPGPGHPTDDVAALREMAKVAAAAFAPFVSGAHASMFGLDNFAELERPMDLQRSFQGADFLKWRSLRQLDDARFLGLTAPRVLMRLPYGDEESRADGFRFREEVAAPDRSGYLWGNGCWAFGAVVIRAFCEYGWLADIRGVRAGDEGGGLVRGLPTPSFSTDARGVALRGVTDGVITESLEQELNDLGFMSLCPLKDTEQAAFFSTPSIQEAKRYDRADATNNARLATMLQYMLCVSRFAHYIKVMGRDKLGSFTTPAEIEREMHNWLIEYCNSDARASLETLASSPLQEGRVQVRESPSKPGCYDCVIHLRPHFQLDRLSTAVRLVTELAPVK